MTKPITKEILNKAEELTEKELKEYWILKINFKEQELLTKNGNYKIVLNNIAYNYNTSSLLISKFKIHPDFDEIDITRLNNLSAIIPPIKGVM